MHLIFLLFTLTVAAQYNLVDDYNPTNFASKFNFFTGNDPTNGYVNYISYDTARSSGLYSVSDNQVYVGVDSSNKATGRGRNSIRLESINSYKYGLIILDLAHMPGSVCGSWPAFWTLGVGETWPYAGEIDIIEGVNSQQSNSMAIHTDAGCSISNDGNMAAQVVTTNCDVNAPNQANNQGCAVSYANTGSYGDGFNAQGGGVYATEITSAGVSIWFFARGAIPADVSSGSPDPALWGLPTGRFAGPCDWNDKIAAQQIIFDVTFCGDWAGNVFSTDPVCSPKANTCQDYVQNNPSAFKESYWSVNSLRVFQQGAPGVAPSSSRTSPSITTTNFASTPSPIMTTLTTVTQVSLSTTTTFPIASLSPNTYTPIAASQTGTTPMAPTTTTEFLASTNPTTANTVAASPASASASQSRWSSWQGGWNSAAGQRPWNNFAGQGQRGG
ncbi:hypothetical protein LTS08_007721 [Lithohypha guttulata]|nr:hypothetical protein LTS08_007721 [Lithohypha guttulata]